MSNIATRIKTFRTCIGWSQAELARKAGLTSAAINQIEMGKKDIMLSTAQKIADALALTIDELNGNASIDVSFYSCDRIYLAELSWILDLKKSDQELLIKIAERLARKKKQNSDKAIRKSDE